MIDHCVIPREGVSAKYSETICKLSKSCILYLHMSECKTYVFTTLLSPLILCCPPKIAEAGSTTGC